MNEKIKCPICEKEFHRLYIHLKIHSLSVEMFLIQFPDYPIQSEYIKNKTSESCKKSKCGSWFKGITLTEEHKKKCSISLIGKNLGKKLTEETKTKMRENHADFRGEKNPYLKAYNKDENLREKAKKNFQKLWQEINSSPEKRLEWLDKQSKSQAESMLKNNTEKKIKSGYKRGYFNSSKFDKKFYYRSSYEKKFLELCEINEKITSLTEVSFFIKYLDGKQTRRYIPDFLVNNKLILEIKSDYNLTQEITKKKIVAGRKYCEENNMIFFIMSNVQEQFESLIEELDDIQP